jgi:outer membrane protein
MNQKNRIFFLTSIFAATSIYANNSYKLPKLNLEEYILTKDSIKSFNKNKIFELKEKEVGKKQEKIKLIDFLTYRLASNENILKVKSIIEQTKIDLEKKYNIFLPKLTFRYFLQLSKQNDYLKDDIYTETQETLEHNYQITAEYNIYNGGKDLLKIKEAQLILKKQYLTYEKVVNEEIIKIIKAYLDLVYINDKIIISNKILKKLEKLLNITIEKEKIGAVSKGDLNSVKALYFKNKSKNISLKNEKKVKANYFKFIAGKDLNKYLPQKEKYNLNLLNLSKLKENILNNVDIKMNKIDTELTKIKIKQTKNTFLPTVDFQLKYENSKIEGRYNPDLAGTENDYYTGKLALNWNLFNRNQDELDYKRNLIDRIKLKHEFKYQEEELLYKLENNYLKIEEIKNNVLNNNMEKLNLKNMLKNYWELYLNGAVNNIEKIIQGEKDLLLLNLNIIDNKKSHVKLFFEIQNITNNLLNYFYIDSNNIYNVSNEELNYKKYNFEKLNKINQEIKKEKLINKNKTIEEIIKNRIEEEKTLNKNSNLLKDNKENKKVKSKDNKENKKVKSKDNKENIEITKNKSIKENKKVEKNQKNQKKGSK